jgi:hypothetical protein
VADTDPITVIVEEAVRVLTNRLVVVSAFAEYKLEKAPTFEPAIEP